MRGTRGVLILVMSFCVLAAGMIVLRGFGAGALSLLPAGINAADASPVADTQLPPVPASDADWRPAKIAERKAVTSSINAQLQAFRMDDYDKAVIYQSSGLRQSFPSVNAFRTMMKHSYPQFTTFKAVQFGPVRMSKDAVYAQAPVTLTGKDGTSVKAVYVMVLEKKLYRVESVIGGSAPVPESPTPEDSRLT